MVQFVHGGRRSSERSGPPFFSVMLAAFQSRSEAGRERAAAAMQDSAQGVYSAGWFRKHFGGIDSPFEKYFVSLWNQEKEAWAKFLFALSYSGDEWFRKFKPFSPFRDGDVVVVAYGMGSVMFSGDTRALLKSGDQVTPEIDEAIRSKGWMVYDGDDYIVVLDKERHPGEVFWMGNKKRSVKTPKRRNTSK